MNSGPTLESNQAITVAAPPRSMGAVIFIGPKGLRAGWKFAIFIIATLLLMSGLTPLAFRIVPPVQPHSQPQISTVLGMELVEAIASLAITALMARFIDKRPFGYFGIPGSQAFRFNFWFGALSGFGVLALQLGLMHIGGWFQFGHVMLHGSDILKYGALWGCVFLCTGFFEESFLRGYPLRVLTNGMGFWPSAILLSVIFAGGHANNIGEDWFGIVMVFIDGMVMCFSVWRTGNLWFAIGNHAAWDWAQTFFFGTPDSGIPTSHALMAPSFSGPPLLSGGTAGPEGSLLVLLSELLIAVTVALLFRKRQYPVEEAVPAVEATVALPQH